jgi:hypothetical protein
MAKPDPDARVIARLDAEEQALLRRAREVTGQTTSAVIKAALRQYAAGLPQRSGLDILRERGLVGSVEGPTDLSENYKQVVDYSGKHGR